MKQVQLTLTIEEANKVLEALSQMPFVHVHQLIGKIHESAKNQIEERVVEQDDHDGGKIKNIGNA
jgi:hypothetical protein